MPSCPKCHTQVESEHNYCGNCGRELDVVYLESPGFLSRDTRNYLIAVMKSDQDIERNPAKYDRLVDEVGRALVEFIYLEPVPGFSLDDVYDFNGFQQILEDEERETIEEIAAERYADDMIRWAGRESFCKMVATTIPEGGEVETVESWRDFDLDVYEIVDLERHI